MVNKRLFFFPAKASAALSRSPPFGRRVPAERPTSADLDFVSHSDARQNDVHSFRRLGPSEDGPAASRGCRGKPAVPALTGLLEAEPRPPRRFRLLLQLMKIMVMNVFGAL